MIFFSCTLSGTVVFFSCVDGAKEGDDADKEDGDIIVQMFFLKVPSKIFNCSSRLRIYILSMWNH